jgi:hypothetical protein
MAAAGKTQLTEGELDTVGGLQQARWEDTRKVVVGGAQVEWPLAWVGVGWALASGGGDDGELDRRLAVLGKSAASGGESLVCSGFQKNRMPQKRDTGRAAVRGAGGYECVSE